MANLHSWSIGIKQTLKKQQSEVKKSDYKFFNISQLENIAERIDDFSETCSTCNDLKANIEQLAHNLPDYLNGNLQKRQEFEKLNDITLKHLRRKHKLYPHNYFMSIYTLIGFTAGAFLGAIVALLTTQVSMFHGVVVGFGIGLLLGYTLGLMKDKKRKQSNMTL